MNQIDAFFQAVRTGDAATLKAMLDAEPRLAGARNDQGQSAVLAAVYSGREEIRDALLARCGALELHEAAAAGQLERVRQIVDKDPSVAKSYSPDGFPVFALAAVFGHRAVAEYLYSQGADANAVATNGTGYTALTGAVASGHIALTAWLLSIGADANHRYSAGYSPLLTAAADGHLEIVKMLLAHGADLHAKSNDGKTALNLAEERKNPHVAEFLRSRESASGKASRFASG
jgi:ankyrin repeat protein